MVLNKPQHRSSPDEYGNDDEHDGDNVVVDDDDDDDYQDLVAVEQGGWRTTSTIRYKPLP